MAAGDVDLDALPGWVWQVPYVGGSFPGAVPCESWRNGANCQLFAYEVLALHGWDVGDLRSDELWADTAATVGVDKPQPLAFVLFQKDEQSYGAHVGVVVGEDQILHLCEEVGTPALWGWAEFAVRPRYRVVLGFKRPTRRLAGYRA